MHKSSLVSEQYFSEYKLEEKMEVVTQNNFMFFNQKIFSEFFLTTLAHKSSY